MRSPRQQVDGTCARADEATPAVARGAPVAERLLALQRTAGNQAVRRLMEQAFDADFSDVHIRQDSDQARAIGARAFTEGSEVHFAPGEYRPHEPVGMELLAHELTHVVQQRERRVAPRQRRAGRWVDPSPALEAEAASSATRAVAGLPARPGAAARSVPESTERGVVQGAFTVSSTVTAEDADEYGPGDLGVTSLQVTDKRRPPTRLGSSQGRHIVAWQAKIRYWEVLFAGMSYKDAIAQLVAMARADEAVDTAMSQADMAERTELLHELEAIDDDTRLPASEWIAKLTWALTTYAKTYQLSSAAAFPSVNPKGKNEAGHLATLEYANDILAGPDRPMKRNPALTGKRRKKQKTDEPAEVPMTRQDLAASARGLIDVQAGLANVVLHKAVKDWLAMLGKLFPNLFKADLVVPPDTEVEKILTGGYAEALRVFDLVGGAGAVLPAPDPIRKVVQEDDEDEEGTALEEESEDPELRTTEPFLIRVPTRVIAGAETEYSPDQLTVSRLIVSDERAPTQFGSKQMSHTLPFSLERLAWVRRFSGRRLEDVIRALLHHVIEEQGWSAQHTQEKVKSERMELLTKLAAGLTASYSVPVWTSWLDAAIEAYVRTNQAAPFATFGTEPGAGGDSTARGRGEAAALAKFERWEAALTDGEPGPTPEDVKLTATKLVEVPGLDMNREAVDLLRLGRRWLNEMAITWPMVGMAYWTTLEEAFILACQPSQHAQELNALLAQEGRSMRSRKRAEPEPIT